MEREERKQDAQNITLSSQICKSMQGFLNLMVKAYQYLEASYLKKISIPLLSTVSFQL